ncbi:MAG: type IV secretion system DNA-binding domain-containing protein [Cyanobacteria bacterium P01_H01_bin.152]
MARTETFPTRFFNSPWGAKLFGSAVLIAWSILANILAPPSSLLVLLLIPMSWRMHHFWTHRQQRKQRNYWSFFSSGLLIMTIILGVGGPWAMILCVIGVFVIDSALSRYANERFLRGAQLTDFQEVFRHYERIRTVGTNILWGGVKRPLHEAMTHFLVAGAAGSGKTLTIRLFMQSILPTIQPGSQRRALVYDAKRDTLAMLEGMGVTCPVHVLNPFDDRCIAWDMAKDIESYADVEATVNILFPKDPKAKEEPFWLDTSRELLTGIIKGLMLYAGSNWTLRDVAIAMSNLEFIKAFLSSDFELAQHLGVLGTQGTTANIMSTIAAKMRPYRLIAAHWDNAQYRISLKEWIASESILVLGKDRRAAESLDALNRLIFVRAIDMLLDKHDVDDPHTFVIFDEFQGAGKIDRFQEMVEQGRSKGISALVGFQAYSAVESVYGEQEANALIGQFKNKCLLRAQDEKTAQWMSGQIGEVEVAELTINTDWKGQGENIQGRGESIRSKPAVMPAEFLNLPQPKKGDTGLTGYYTGDFIYKASYNPTQLSELLRSSGPASMNFTAAPRHHERLKPWSEEDLERLCIPPGLNLIALPQSTNSTLEKSDTAVTPQSLAPSSPDEPEITSSEALKAMREEWGFDEK